MTGETGEQRFQPPPAHNCIHHKQFIKVKSDAKSIHPYSHWVKDKPHFVENNHNQEFSSSLHLCLLLHEGRTHMYTIQPSFQNKAPVQTGRYWLLFTIISERCATLQLRLGKASYIRLNWKHYFGMEYRHEILQSSFRDFRFQRAFISMMCFSESVWFR